jgi:hypothetical protein
MATKPLVMRPLSTEMAAQAYPLVRDLPGAGTLEKWMSFIEQHLAQGDQAGVLICERGPYIRGLFGWETKKGVGDQRQLVIRHFSVPGVLPASDVINALLEAVDALADRLDCHEIQVEMPLSDKLHPAFAEHGLVFGSVGLHRHLVKKDGTGRKHNA